MESAGGAPARGAIDLAIIETMADGGLRRSEAAALTWGDVEFWEDGSARRRRPFPKREKSGTPPWL